MAKNEKKPLDPDIREAVIEATVAAVLADMREHPVAPPSPWLTVNEAAAYAHVGRKIIFAAISSGRLRGAHVDGRRKIIIRREWIDAWLAAAAPEIVEWKKK